MKRHFFNLIYLTVIRNVIIFCVTNFPGTVFINGISSGGLELCCYLLVCYPQ